MNDTDIMEALENLTFGLDALDCLQIEIAESINKSDIFANGLYYVLNHFRADLDALKQKIEEEAQG